MSSEKYNLAIILGSSLLLLLGHLIRTFRWRMILSSSNLYVSTRKPLLALTLGYNVGIFTPLFVGDLFRSFILSALEKIDPILTLATVVYERTIDLLIITSILIFIAISFQNGDGLPVRFILLISLLIVVIRFLQKSENLRKLIWSIVSIFNPKLRTTILHFMWNLNAIFHNQTINKNNKFWFLTLAMWLSYLTSLWLFCIGINVEYKLIFIAIYGEPGLQSFLTVVTKATSVGVLPLAIYLVFPPVIVSLLVLLRAKPKWQINRQLSRLSGVPDLIIESAKRNYPSFSYEKDYVDFLESKFSGDKSIKSVFTGEGLEGLTVLKIFPGGSTAVTALLEIDSKTVVRKFASYEVANNLEKQVVWLQQFEKELPVVKLNSKLETNSKGIFYDMEFKKSTREFYDVIQNEQLEFSRAILQSALNSISNFHKNKKLADLDEEKLIKYFETKIKANLDFLRTNQNWLFNSKDNSINGKLWDSRYLEFLENYSQLKSLVGSRSQAVIHGDLTIENMLVDMAAKTRDASWYLIDPNPNSEFSSPLNDYSKLMQSLNLGYESINRQPEVTKNDLKFELNIRAIPEYEILKNDLTSFIRQNFGEEALREVYLHEIVDYLRLIPYQSRKSEYRGLAFTVGLAILIQEFNERYLSIN